MGFFSKKPDPQDKTEDDNWEKRRNALFEDRFSELSEALAASSSAEADSDREKAQDLRAKSIDRLVFSFWSSLRDGAEDGFDRFPSSTAGEELAARLFRLVPALLEAGKNESNVFKLASLLVKTFHSAFDQEVAVDLLTRRIAFLRENEKRTPSYQELFAFTPLFFHMGEDGCALQEAFADLVIDRAQLCKARWEGSEQPTEKFMNVIEEVFPASRYDALLDAFCTSARGFSSIIHSPEISGALMRDFIKMREKFSGKSFIQALFSFQERISCSLTEGKTADDLQRLKDWPQTLRDACGELLVHEENADLREKSREKFDAGQDLLVEALVPALLEKEFHNAAASIVMREVAVVSENAQELVNLAWRTEKGMAQICAGDAGQISILETRADTYVLPPKELIEFIWKDATAEELGLGVKQAVQTRLLNKIKALPSFAQAYHPAIRFMRQRAAEQALLKAEALPSFAQAYHPAMRFMRQRAAERALIKAEA